MRKYAALFLVLVFAAVGQATIDLEPNYVGHWKMNEVDPWKRLADMPAAKFQHGFAESNGVLYAVCGVDATINEVNTLFAYDVATNAWSTKAPAPATVQSAVWRAVKGKFYLIGGYADLVYYNTNYEYDPDTNSWTQKANMPTAREDMGGAVIDDKICVLGGLSTGNTIPKKVEVYDPNTNTWDTSKPNLPDSRLLGDFSCDYNGNIYLVSSANTIAGYPNIFPTTSVLDYNLNDGSYITKDEIPHAVCYKEVEGLDDKIYCIGGADVNSYACVRYNQIFDIDSGSWEDSDLIYPSIYALGMAVTKYDGKLYYCGGSHKNSITKRSFSFDPSLSRTPGGILQIVDSSGNGHHGTSAGLFGVIRTQTLGKVNGAQNFDGTYDSINLGDHNDFDLTVLSISVWLKTTNTSSQIIMGKQHTTSYYVSASANKVYFFTNDASTASSDVALSNGNWHHVVVTFDGSNRRIYVDNVLCGGPTAGTIQIDDKDLRIGDSGYGHSLFNGDIDDVRLYNKALDVNEIAFLCNNGNGRESSKKGTGLISLLSGGRIK